MSLILAIAIGLGSLVLPFDEGEAVQVRAVQSGEQLGGSLLAHDVLIGDERVAESVHLFLSDSGIVIDKLPFLAIGEASFFASPQIERGARPPHSGTAGKKVASRAIVPQRHPDFVTHFLRRSLASVPNDYVDPGGRILSRGYIEVDRNVGPKLLFVSVPSDAVGAIGKPESKTYPKQAESAESAPNYCPPGRVSGCIRRFPLSAQIVIALIAPLAAWWALYRATEPFGFIVLRRTWKREALGYGLLSLGLFGLSLGMWMLPG